MVLKPEYKCVIIASVEGQIGILSSLTGEILFLQDVADDGVPDVIISMDISGERIAAGTVGGLVFVYSLENSYRSQSCLDNDF